LKWTVLHSGSEIGDLHLTVEKIRAFSDGDDEVGNLLTHRAMGFTCMLQGKLEKAHDEFEHFFDLFDYEKYAKSVSFQFSSMNDVSGSALAMATICLLRKQPETANQWRDKALAWALRSHNQVAICQSLVFSGGFIAGLQRRADEMMEHMTQAHHYANKHQLNIWVPYIELSMALSQLVTNHDAANERHALTTAAQNIDILLEQNGPYMTVWATMYARACLLHSEYESGLNVLARVEKRVESGERWMNAEYIRLVANFKYALSITDAEAFLIELETAHALANKQGALVFVDDILRDINMLKLSEKFINSELMK
jgi:hypothetical protein